MDTMKICPGCHKPLAPNAPDGLCPKCLVKAGLPTGAEIGPDSEIASRFVAFAAPSVEVVARLFPQLEILGFIGQGGMGAVYRARQKELDRVVALKILPPDIGRDASFAERFMREARTLARLNHPGIVTLYEFGRADGLFFFLMEFVDGVNLRQLLAGDRLSSREALAIVPQICDALQYAHDQGIVHRDIKPENILLDRQGRVKVADFGLAKLLGPGEETPSDAVAAAVRLSAPTESGKVMGTPQYMAPEQRKRPTEVDHRADIYSLGVVFYQMLTGELPGEPIARPSSRSREMRLDVRLDEVVLKALESEPERRYQQASQVKTDVETISGTPPAGQGPVRGPMVALRRPRMAMAGAVLARLQKPLGIGFILFAVVWSILFPKTREIFRPDFVASVAIGFGLFCFGIAILFVRQRNVWQVALSVALMVIALFSVFFLSQAAQGRRALRQLEADVAQGNHMERMLQPAKSAAPPAEAWKTSPAMSSEDLVAKGFDLLEKRDYRGATAIFEAFIRENPDQADAYHGLAIAQRETGNPAMAISNHNRAIELTPERADYYWWQGVTYQRLTNHETAIQAFERGLEAQNKKRLRPGLLHASLAQEYRAKGNLQKALELNEQAIALDPENQWYYLERGHTYSALGQPEKADADFARSGDLRTKPGSDLP